MNSKNIAARATYGKDGIEVQKASEVLGIWAVGSDERGFVRVARICDGLDRIGYDLSGLVGRGRPFRPIGPSKDHPNAPMLSIWLSGLRA